MKKWTWKEWTSLGLVIVCLIAETVAVFVAPLAALLAASTALVSFIAGWLAGKHVEIKGNDNNKEENAARMGWN